LWTIRKDSCLVTFNLQSDKCSCKDW
jgi:hypothetical protein